MLRIRIHSRSGINDLGSEESMCWQAVVTSPMSNSVIGAMPPSRNVVV